MLRIRPETSDDHANVRAVNIAAFGRDDEADYVDGLREDGAVLFLLVAEQDGEVVADIVFSPLGIERNGTTVNGAALAPIAVTPERQNEGIGSALVRAGLEVCKKANIDAVVVLGHPTYYPRFGFSATLAEGLSAPFSGAAFMALELTPGCLSGGGFTVHYARAFDL